MNPCDADVLDLVRREHPLVAARLDDPRIRLAGFVGTSRGIFGVLPACYASTTRRHPPLPDALLLMRVLRRYRHDGAARRAVRGESSASPRPFAGGSRGLLGVVEAGLELVSDYQDQGLLRFRRQVLAQSDRGRIDWPRTVTRESAFFCEDAPLYLRPHRRLLKYDDAHPLTHAHATTLADACRQMGLQQTGATLVPHESVSPSRIRRTLLVERSRVYRDRDLRVCQLIGAYWSGRELASLVVRRADWDVTDNFELVWEEMCRVVLGGRRRPEGLDMPGGRYFALDGEPIGMGSGLDLRPDILLAERDSRDVLVLDAKFYTANALPKTADILKQLAYGHFLSASWRPALKAPRLVTNAFLFPALWDGGNWVRVVGRHVVHGGAGKPMGADIWLVEADYRRVANAYAARRRLDPQALMEVLGAARSSAKEPNWRRG
jgi:hypothetical protein